MRSRVNRNRRLTGITRHVAASAPEEAELATATKPRVDALGVPIADTASDAKYAWTKKVRGVLWEKYDGDLEEADKEIAKLGSPFSGAG